MYVRVCMCVCACVILAYVSGYIYVCMWGSAMCECVYMYVYVCSRDMWGSVHMYECVGAVYGVLSVLLGVRPSA